MSKKSRLKNWTLGETRYITYYLIFPGDDKPWVDQIPFNGPLDTFLPLTRFNNDFTKMTDLRTKGETTWKDHNGVTHLVKVEDKPKPRTWGTK